MSGESITDVRSTLRAHEQNKAQGEAYIRSIKRTDQTLHIEFTLPYGETTFDKDWPDTDAIWQALYGHTGASPPCVDTLLGESVPIHWDATNGEWTLTLDSLAQPQAPDEQGRPHILQSEFDTPIQWGRYILSPFLPVVLLSGVLGAAIAAGFTSGHALIGLACTGVLALVWLWYAARAAIPLRDLYRGDYDWIAD